MLIETVKQTQSGYVVNSVLFVPNDEGNRDYQSIQKWIAEGGVVAPEYTPEELLAKAKAAKKTEMQNERDTRNVTPITDTEGAILNESEELTGDNTLFVFYTNRHPVNPASDPTTILTSVIVQSAALPYVTEDLEGNRVIINLDPTLARFLATHLTTRNNNNYKLYNAIVIAINSATTVEEVEAITWDPSYIA